MTERERSLLRELVDVKARLEGKERDLAKLAAALADRTRRRDRLEEARKRDTNIAKNKADIARNRAMAMHGRAFLCPHRATCPVLELKA